MSGDVPESAWHLPLPDLSTRNRPKVSAYARDKVYRRDGGACRRCGTDQDLTIDHVRPLSKGGANRIENMQLLCWRCNHDKGST